LTLVGEISEQRNAVGSAPSIRGVVPFALHENAKNWELPADVFNAVVPPVDVDVP